MTPRLNRATIREREPTSTRRARTASKALRKTVPPAPCGTVSAEICSDDEKLASTTRSSTYSASILGQDQNPKFSTSSVDSQQVDPDALSSLSSATPQSQLQDQTSKTTVSAGSGQGDSLLTRRLKTKIKDISSYSNDQSVQRSFSHWPVGNENVPEILSGPTLPVRGAQHRAQHDRIAVLEPLALYQPTPKRAYSIQQLSTMAGYPSGPPYHLPSHHGSSRHSPYSSHSLAPNHYASVPPFSRHDSTSTRDSPSEGPSTPPQTHAEPIIAMGEASDDLLSRISSAIPDLHLLLSRYKETHGELGAREQLIRKAEAKQVEAMKKNEDHINGLMKQIDDMKKKHAAETNKYRLDVRSLEDKQRESEERLSELEASRKKLHAANRGVEAEKRALLNERQVLAKTNADEMARMKGALEAEKKKVADEMARMKEALNAEKKKVAGEMARMKEALDAEKKKVADDKEREAEEGLKKATEELEAKLSKLTSDYDDACAKRDESTKTLEEERASFEKRLDEKVEEHKNSLTKEFEEHRAKLATQQEADMAALIQKHKDDLNDQTRGFVMLQENLNKMMTAENGELRKEIEALKLCWDEDKAKLEKALSEAKGVAEEA